MAPVRLISLGKQFTLKIDWEKIDWEDKGLINLPHVMGYYFGAKTDKMSIAKTYEDENTMIVTLQIPKSNYKNKSFQNLLKCPELPVQDEYYYRDWAVHMVMAGENEKTVLFSHGRVTLDVKDNAKADYVIVEVVVKQKEDMLRGVVFGLKLDETYKEAWEKVMNPVGLNVVVPVVAASSGVVLTGIKNAKEIIDEEGQDLEENGNEEENLNIHIEYSAVRVINYSAFSIGSDLYNVSIESLNKTSNASAITTYIGALSQYYYINPAEYFTVNVNKNFKLQTFLMNNHTIKSENPRKQTIIDAMKTSDIIYLVTHGSRSGIHIQDIDFEKNNISTNGIPILNSSGTEFLASNFEYLHYNDLAKSKIGFIKMKWLIIAGCGQLNSNIPWISGNVDGSKNATEWAKTLIRNNSVHGILGYYDLAPTFTFQNEVLKYFITAIQDGKSFADAWKYANTQNTNKNWAIVYKYQYVHEGINHILGVDTLKKSKWDDNIFFIAHKSFSSFPVYGVTANENDPVTAIGVQFQQII